MFEYDVTLSFAGEDRNIVEPIAILLRYYKIKVFYDNFETSNLWGKDLYQYLQSIYRDKSLYCIIFCSRHYVSKAWTMHELRQAQERAFNNDHEYILPIRLDNSLIPGINSTTGYIEFSKYSTEQIVELIVQKCNKHKYAKLLFNESFRFVTARGNVNTIPFNRILYIQHLLRGKKVKITTIDNVSYFTYNFSQIEYNLNFFPFIKCSERLIININYLKSLDSKTMTLTLKDHTILDYTAEYATKIIQTVQNIK